MVIVRRSRVLGIEPVILGILGDCCRERRYDGAEGPL